MNGAKSRQSRAAGSQGPIMCPHDWTVRCLLNFTCSHVAVYPHIKAWCFSEPVRSWDERQGCLNCHATADLTSMRLFQNLVAHDQLGMQPYALSFVPHSLWKLSHPLTSAVANLIRQHQCCHIGMPVLRTLHKTFKQSQCSKSKC